jgi:hypothetical protein
MYKNWRESHGIYENVSKSLIYKWFTSRGEFNDGNKKYISEGSFRFQERIQHRLLLFKYHKVEDFIIKNLKAYGKAKQLLYARSLKILSFPSLRKNSTIAFGRWEIVF